MKVELGFIAGLAMLQTGKLFRVPKQKLHLEPETIIRDHLLGRLSHVG